MKTKLLCTITLKCDNNCLNCFIPFQVRNNGCELTLADLQDLLSEVLIQEGDVIEISGGEPTIHRELISILEFFRETYPAKLVLITNAQRLANICFADRISALIDGVVTNIYDVAEATHDKISRIPGSLFRKIQGLKNLDKRGVEISLKVIPILLNYRRIEKLVRFAAATFSRPHLIVKTLDITGSAQDNKSCLAVSHSQIKQHLEVAVNQALKLGLTVDLFFPLCLLEQHLWQFAPPDENQSFGQIIYISPNRGKMIGSKFPATRPEKCQGCALQNRCVWFWENYFPIFGDGELNPISLNPPL